MNYEESKDEEEQFTIASLGIISGTYPYSNIETRMSGPT